MIMALGWCVLALVMLALGGDSVLKGASGLSRRFGWSPFVTGLLLVAFGTSIPELAVNARAFITGSQSLALGNAIGLMFAAEDMYGKVLSIPDAVMPTFYRLATRLPLAEVSEIIADLESGRLGPMDAKMRLAREIVTQYHSAEAAQAAEERFIQVHREHAVPEDVAEHTLTAADLPLWLPALMKQIGMVSSTSDAIRQIESGGVQVDGVRVPAKDFKITVPGKYLIQKGKRHFARVIVGE